MKSLPYAFGVILLSLLAAGSAHARCTSTDACLREIEAAQRQTRTMTADFHQVKHLSLLEQPLTSKGRLVFKHPDRVLLEITEPHPARLVVDGTTVRMPGVDAADQAALAMAPFGRMFADLGTMLTGSLHRLREGFEVEATDEAGAVSVHLVPRRAQWQRSFREIELRFARPDLTPQGIRLFDALGDRLEITLSNVRRNADVPDSIFDVAP